MTKEFFKVKNAKLDIACLGILVLDIFGKTIDSFPEKGTTNYFESMGISPGGCAYNTGIDCCRLGMNGAVMGKVGNDLFGEIVIKKLKEEKVNIEGVCTDDTMSTAFSFIMVPEDGDRRIYHTPGANDTYNIDDVQCDIISNAKIFHIAGASLLPAIDGYPSVKLLEYARQQGTITSMDPVVKKDIGKLIIPCLKYLDIFLPNYEESVYITELENPYKQLEFYIEKGVKLAGIKLGKDGCIIYDGTTFWEFGIYKVPTVDTCGAGDAFIAGFLYGVIEGWGIEECGKFATATASFCVREIGTTSAVPSSGDVIDYMNNNKMEEFKYADYKRI